MCFYFQGRTPALISNLKNPVVPGCNSSEKIIQQEQERRVLPDPNYYKRIAWVPSHSCVPNVLYASVVLYCPFREGCFCSPTLPQPSSIRLAHASKSQARAWMSRIVHLSSISSSYMHRKRSSSDWAQLAAWLDASSTRSSSTAFQ